MDAYTAKGGGKASAICPSCICTVVGRRALDALLEASKESSGAGEGVYRDSHPWIIGRELLDAARQAGQRLPVVFAVDAPLALSHWAFVKWIEVRELHRGAWETRCGFEPLRPVHPIWEALDSMTLAPSVEQLHREAVEPVQTHRQMLDESQIRPYAVCETPAFILQPTPPPPA